MATNETVVNGSHVPHSIQALQDEASQLKDAIKLERMKYADTTLKEASSKVAEVSLVSPLLSMKTRKILKSQCKVMAFDWSPDQRHIISGGENGHAIIWDGFTSHRELLVETKCGWILSCAYSPSTTLVACGGLNKKCMIYSVSVESNEKNIRVPKTEVANHDKYITKCLFFGSDQQLLTASADSKIALWDVEKESAVQEFLGHRNEVMGLAVHQSNPYSVFASCGNDQCTCLWDARSGECVRRIDDYKSEINEVVFYPTGNAIATAANDGTVRLFDLKADQEVMLYSKPSILLSASSLDFSRSGRLVFVGYVDHTLRAWDVLKGEQLALWYDHEDRISHVQVSPDGTAVGTCSWDSTIRIWA